MRVLHVITGLAAGGAEQQLRMLLPHSDAAAEVATLTNPGSVAAAIRAEGTPVYDLAMRGNRDIGVLPRLVRLMRQGRYDLVHTHLYRACLYGRLAARMAGVPHVVATEHSLGDTLIEGRPRTHGVRAHGVRMLYLAGERLGDVTIAVSETVRRRLVGWGVPAGRVVVVPNGLDAARFRFDPQVRRRSRHRLGIAPDAFVVGGVGRLDPVKRFDVLVRAVAGLDVTLLLVGEGPQRHRLAELARALGSGFRVVFTGESMDVAAELAAMDLLVAPSLDETFGLAVLEALAAGIPVLYTRCPALQDLPPQAAPAAVRVAPDEASLRAALHLAVRQRAVRTAPPPAVAHYDIARVAAEVDQVYRQLRAASPRWRVPGVRRQHSNEGP